MTLNRVLGAAAIAAACGVFGTAHATSVTTGDIQVNLGGGSTETQIFLDSNSSTLVGTGHVGSQSGDPGTPVITFTVDQAASFANGFADISALPPSDGVYKSLTISVPTGWFFTDMDFSTHKANQVTFTAMNGSTVVGTYSNDAVGNNDADWLLVAISGNELTSLILTSTDGFDQIKQFEISGLEQVCPEGVICNHQSAAPLPAAVWLMGSILGGGAGAGAWRRRKQRAKTA
jgi:hypothetical protein